VDHDVLNEHRRQPMSAAGKVDWSQLGYKEVRPGVHGATVHTPRLTVTQYRYEAGSAWEEHQHPQDQVTTVLVGEIEFVVDGATVHLGPGQTATVPGGTPHSAAVPAEGGCVTVNVLTSRPDPPGV
jgi:quercetin dioxygenase-like cupin family protein